MPVEQDEKHGVQCFGLEATMEQVEPGNDGDINNQVEECLLSRGSRWHATSQKQLSSSWRQNTAPGTEPGTQGASQWTGIRNGVSTQGRKLDSFFFFLKINQGKIP